MQKYDKTEWVPEVTLVSADNLNKVENQLEKLTNDSIKLNEQLGNITKHRTRYDGLKDIIYKIKIGEINKVRFIGDSIGQGSDVPNASEDENGVITFDWYGDIHRESRRDTLGYVNYLRNTLKQLNPNLDLINASIGGRSVKEACNLRTGYKFSDGGEDLIFLCLSTNDLHMCNNIDEFVTQYKIFLEYLQTKTKYIVLMTTPLVYLESITSSSNKITARQTTEKIKLISYEYGLPCIDLYESLLEMIYQGSLNYYTYFNDDTVHPSTQGHFALFLIVCRYLNISLNDDNFYLDRFTRWSKPTLLNNWQDLSDTIKDFSSLKYTMIGKNRVKLNGIIGNGNYTDPNISLMTISQICSPTKTIFIPCMYNTSSGEKKTCVIQVNNNGNIGIFGEIHDCSWIVLDLDYYI